MEDDREILLEKIEEDLQGETSFTRVGADIVVCDSVLKVSTRSLLAMVLKGGAVMSSSFLLDGSGPILVFRDLLHTPKWLCLSDQFKKEAPGLAGVIRDMLVQQSPPRLWKILSFDIMMVRSLADQCFILKINNICSISVE